jgi:hypothetical protein
MISVGAGPSGMGGRSWLVVEVWRADILAFEQQDGNRIAPISPIPAARRPGRRAVADAGRHERV